MSRKTRAELDAYTERSKAKLASGEMSHGTQIAYCSARCHCPTCSSGYSVYKRVISTRTTMVPVLREVAWHRDAACRGMLDLMFGESPTQIARAKRVCARCPVLDRCRTEHADEDFGVWFGTDRLERRAAKLGVADEFAAARG